MTAFIRISTFLDTVKCERTSLSSFSERLIRKGALCTCLKVSQGLGQGSGIDTEGPTLRASTYCSYFVELGPFPRQIRKAATLNFRTFARVDQQHQLLQLPFFDLERSKAERQQRKTQTASPFTFKRWIHDPFRWTLCLLPLFLLER